MSLRYTGEATMDGPALRDVERWKDKIEVRLDNRQVFFLFFGSAMVACMLFVLGVIVGKRLESRGRAEAPAVEDPLAALDRFGSAPSSPSTDSLTFPKSLIAGNGSPKTRSGAVLRDARSAKPTLTTAAPSLAGGAGILVPLKESPEPVVAPAPVAAEPPAKAHTAPSSAESGVAMDGPVLLERLSGTTLSKKLAALPRPVSPGAKTTTVASSGSPAPVTAKTSVSAPAKAVAPAPVKAAVLAPAAAALPKTTPVASKNTAPVSAKPPATSPSPASDKTADKNKGHFLLQLSSFQDRAEADAFARRFSGKNAYVVSTDLPGKGTWYRVRVGNYATMQEASVAKTAFEREHNVIAYVAGTGPVR